MAKTKASNYQLITNAIIAALDKGVVPWQQPWKSDYTVPRRMADPKGRAYRGLNSFILGAAGFSNPWFGTYKALVKDNGSGPPPKGEGFRVFRWIFIDKKDSDGLKTGDTFPILKVFTVWNVTQVEWPEGMPAKFEVQLDEAWGGAKFTPLAAIKSMIASFVNGPTVKRGGGRAFYRPSTDSVTVPASADFDAPESEFNTMAHELVHATGHTSRLDRLTRSGFGSGDYAREELVAEMGAAFLASEFGVTNDNLEQSASYIAHWRAKLTADPKLIITAAAEAAKAVALITEEGVSA